MPFYWSISVLLGALPLLCLWGYRPWMPRSKWLGVCIGVPVLVISAIYGTGMLPAGHWRSLCYALVPVVSVLSYFLLDYLAARAIGGAMALSANFLISHAFAYDVPFRSLYCTVVLLSGLMGMALIAWPWWLRDAGDFCVGLPPLKRKKLTICLSAPALLLLICPLI